MTLLMTCVVVAGAAALIGCYRLLKGPSHTDRVIALDLLFAIAVVLSLIAALASGRTLYLDVAFGMVLVGFVATLAWARLIQVGATPRSEEEAS